jgi:hypothetical protein
MLECCKQFYLYKNCPIFAEEYGEINRMHHRVKLKLVGEKDLRTCDYFVIKICYIDLFCLKTKYTMGFYKVAMYLTGITGSITNLNCNH